ncbi:MAG: substrate-binding domain-containing protein [Mitsuaria chitosanitabida]|uniref:substrate-binding domain-containing protein n=1 Tax=Roseateles chitosanitabidus TaxID=65048 RepID=UPI001B09FE9E|nr:substrate-binding domain-containing protein [Roseateles chitosanitabidus]MBO9685296.1 substrate-binding domain-containing protein [Roseateles chitosanitabidus]
MQFAKVKLSSLAIAAGLMVVAGAASAQAVTSGGATLPQQLYTDIFTNGPIQGVWSYNGTGSGTGKTAFLTNNASLFGKTGTVHIVGSDSALTSAEVTTYNSAYNTGASSTVANYGRLVQIPAVATPVLLGYKETGVTALNLTTEQVCRVYAYDANFRTWDKVATVADDGANGSTNPIQVVFRTDTSGTTELLSRFLNAACGPYLPAGKSFTISNNFKTVVASAQSLTAADDANGDGLPDAWVGATGSSGVSSALATDHRLGYVSPDPVYTGSSNSNVARINTFLPTAASIQSAISAITPPATALARANPLNWVPAYAVPTGAYPIYGTTNLVLGQCYAGGIGAGTSAAAVKDFVTKLNNGAYDSKIASHNFVKLPANWNTAIQQAFLTSGSTLEIGATSVCAGIGR